MQAVVLGVLCGLAASVWAASPVRAKCERLHAAVQPRIQEATAENREPEVLAQARQCVAEGMKRHRQGQHWEAMQTLRRCLTLLV
jgi:hypothetical protein